MNTVMLTPFDGTDSQCSHPSHTGFANAVDATIHTIPPPPTFPLNGSIIGDVVRNRRWTPPEADVYLYEYADAYHSMPVLRKQYPDALHVPLATHLIFGRTQFNLKRLDEDFLRNVDRTAAEFLYRRALRGYADGIIAVSGLVADYLRSWLAGHRPVEVCEPYVQPDIGEELAGVSPGLEHESVVVVCDHREHKGIDILVESWSRVRAAFPDAQLHIVGRNHPREFGNEPGVTVQGYVENLTRLFEDVSLYVHPARVDGFAVSVTEALAAGVPAIVTNTTGARSATSELGEKFVVRPDADSLSEAIVEYFECSVSERRQLSERAREIGLRYTEQRQTEQFEAVFEEIVETVK